MTTARPRWPFAIVTGLLACVIAVAALGAVAYTDHAKCDGDGGVPYSAADSPAGSFCDGPLRTPWALAAPLLVLLAIGAPATARRAWLWVWFATVVSVAALLCLTTPMLALGQSCSDRDTRAYDRWIEAGRAGPRPADSEKY